MMVWRFDTIAVALSASLFDDTAFERVLNVSR
ncbi:hypothetical protein AWB82_02506 [Caballeronia glebae]|uniref:Uncharacterized protein n=1 Tax=Caballeronia glebae TaxID=1777143 RepID=A0A158AKD0_9BURK|nr:hypothetical protein AWB82_02506 [Caballeronia glebae]